MKLTKKQRRELTKRVTPDVFMEWSRRLVAIIDAPFLTESERLEAIAEMDDEWDEFLLQFRSH